MSKSLKEPYIQTLLVAEEASKKKRRVQTGVTTSNLVQSAHVGGNADIFPQILALHVLEGSTIADVTYGTGIFWQNHAHSLSVTANRFR